MQKVISTKLGEGILLLSTSGYPMLMVILMNKANSAFVDSMALMRWTVTTVSNKITKKFVVDKGDDTLVISVDI
ncbi:hypothetical protein KY285_021336 [Solanum tuberosum]|nr:hypothetical protein KY285_021336 [Solanum tuberosum]